LVERLEEIIAGFVVDIDVVVVNFLTCLSIEEFLVRVYVFPIVLHPAPKTKLETLVDHIAPEFSNGRIGKIKHTDLEGGFACSLVQKYCDFSIRFSDKKVLAQGLIVEFCIICGYHGVEVGCWCYAVLSVDLVDIFPIFLVSSL
jgi:hypothetical protein